MVYFKKFTDTDLTATEQELVSQGVLSKEEIINNRTISGPDQSFVAEDYAEKSQDPELSDAEYSLVKKGIFDKSEIITHRVLSTSAELLRK
jgi:hypothetical protein